MTQSGYRHIPIPLPLQQGISCHVKDRSSKRCDNGAGSTSGIRMILRFMEMPKPKFLSIYAHMSNYGTSSGARKISMPGLNGTGPQGSGPMSGRGFGRCRTAHVPAQEHLAPEQLVHDENGPAISQGSVQNIPVYGRGRGGIPCGCGRGFGFGGGRRLRG